MLGSEPEGHSVFCIRSEVWERGLWSVRLSSSCLRQGLLEGRGEALKEIRDVRVSEKLLHCKMAFLSCVIAQVCELLLRARPCVK